MTDDVTPDGSTPIVPTSVSTPSDQQEENNVVVEEAHSELKIKLEAAISEKEKIGRESAGSLMAVNMENLRLVEENQKMTDEIISLEKRYENIVKTTCSRITALHNDLREKKFEADAAKKEQRKEVEKLKHELSNCRNKIKENEKRMNNQSAVHLRLKNTEDDLKSVKQETDKIRKQLEETLLLKNEADDTSKKQSEEISELKKTASDQALHISQLERNEKEIRKEIEETMVQKMNARAKSLQQQLAVLSNQKSEADAIMAKQIEDISESLKHLGEF